MRTWILVAVLAPFYFAPPHAVAQQPNLNQVLSWLPGDTETVLAANGPFAWNPKALSNDSPTRERLSATELEMQSRMFPLAAEFQERADRRIRQVQNRIVGNRGLAPAPAAACSLPDALRRLPHH